MKHEADQFEMFPDREDFRPGQTVNPRRLKPGKRHTIPDPSVKFRVISWPLYFLLSGNDPEFEDPTDFLEDGYAGGAGPDPDEVPILTDLETIRLRAEWREGELRGDDMVFRVLPYTITKGY